MEAALHLVPDLPDEFTGEPTPANFAIVMTRLSELEAQTRELQSKLMKAETRRASDDLADELDGAKATITLQNRKIGNLKRQIADDADPMSHPSGREIIALIERWKRGVRPKAKTSADRVKLVKARLRDEYTFDELELAVDGLCAFPYRRYDDRLPEDGPGCKRDDDLEVALKKAARVEMFARLGYRARKEGLVAWGEES